MIDTELRLKANRAIDGNATLQGVRLELGKDHARVMLLTPFREDFGSSGCEWWQFELSGIGAVACWTHGAPLAPELASVTSPSPQFMEFLASLFREQRVYEWGNFFPSLSTEFQAQPTWMQERDPHFRQQDSISIFVELNGMSAAWTLCIWFARMKIKSPGQDNISFADFVGQLPPETDDSEA